MKTMQHYFLIFLPMIFSVFTMAQCPTEIVRFTSQAEINAFATNYPNCTTINYHVNIGPSTDIIDLRPLENITSIAGDIKIIENEALTSLDGLQALSGIGASFSIKDNPKLNSLEALKGISNITGFFIVNNCDALISLSGIENITYIGGSLGIVDNAMLTSLSELENLTYVGALDIFENALLTSLSGLHNIDPSSIPELRIINNPLLSFCNLPNICSYLIYDQGANRRSISRNAPGCENEMAVHTACLPEVVSVASLEDILVECPAPFSGLTLPETVMVTYDDDNTGQLAVNWEQGDYQPLAGSYTITGILNLMGESTNPNDLKPEILVHVEDNQAPDPDIADLPSLTGTCSVTISEIPTASDACTGTITATTEDPLHYNEQGSYVITWTYADGYGNTSSQTQTVIVEITSTPEMVCTETHIVTCDPVVTFDLPVATGECGTVPVVQTDRTGLTSGSVFPVGKTTLTYRASNSAGSATCAIEIEVLPELEIQHVSGVQNGDTLHLAACIPPGISKVDLDLGPHQPYVSVGSSIYREDLPSDPDPGLWKMSRYVYHVNEYCGGTESFENYVALYDLDPPVFRYFPRDITIDSAMDLPPVPEDVVILDICRFVVWDTVMTIPVEDPVSGEIIAYTRRWIAEDEVGNKSFRDQMIYLRSTPKPVFSSITAHISKETDLIDSHFPGSAGTDHIPVTLYRLDSNTLTTELVDSTVSGNWQGSQGSVFFTPVLPGTYRLKIEVPEGYVASDPDSLFQVDGWSDPLRITDGLSQDLGSILLLPVPDTLITDTMSLPVETDSIQVDTFIFAAFESKLASAGEVLNRSDFIIYPNPTEGKIRIDISEAEAVEYKIVSHLGKVVKQGQVISGSAIDLRGHPDGMYFMQVWSEERLLGSQRVLLLAR